MTDSDTRESAERDFVDGVRGMLARPDYLIPLAAAERQFRDHYYGLNSAALLEDLFFDALGNFFRQTQPDVQLVRPPTGQKGWDYKFNGLQISHKVSQGLDAIAALWDATKQGVETWSFDEPITYVLGGNAPPKIVVQVPGLAALNARSVGSLGRPYLLDGRTLLVVLWPQDGSQPALLDVLASQPGQTVGDVLPFERIWRLVAERAKNHEPVNDIDVLVTTRRLRANEIDRLREPSLDPSIDLSAGRRSGVYVLSRDTLQNLAVTSNNRAILIPKTTVASLLDLAVVRGSFIPLPLWYWAYSAERPPDMYSTQRAEFDARFSARGIRDG